MALAQEGGVEEDLVGLAEGEGWELVLGHGLAVAFGAFGAHVGL